MPFKHLVAHGLFGLFVWGYIATILITILK